MTSSLRGRGARRAASGAIALAALAATAGAATPPAEPSPTVGAFERICLSPGDRQPPDVARTEGFVTPPEIFEEQFRGRRVPKGSTVLWKAVEGRVVVLLYADVPAKKGDEVDAEGCVVMALPAERGAEEALEAHLGLGSGEREKDGSRTLVFRQGPDGRVPIESYEDAALERLVQAEEFRAVFYGGSENDKRAPMTTMTLYTPRPR